MRTLLTLAILALLATGCGTLPVTFEGTAHTRFSLGEHGPRTTSLTYEATESASGTNDVVVAEEDVQ